MPRCALSTWCGKPTTNALCTNAACAVDARNGVIRGVGTVAIGIWTMGRSPNFAVLRAALNSPKPKTVAVALRPVPTCHRDVPRRSALPSLARQRLDDARRRPIPWNLSPTPLQRRRKQRQAAPLGLRGRRNARMHAADQGRACCQPQSHGQAQACNEGAWLKHDKYHPFFRKTLASEHI